MKLAVSVVIPCYNHGHYLGQALDSVLAQTFADWEAIVVDDGSTDDTAAVAAGFTDPRIRYLYQQNQGLSAARNAGIDAARGRFLAFLDADDEWDPRFLECCLAALNADEDLAGVYTRCTFIDQDGRVLPQVGGQALAGDDFWRRLLEGGFFPVHAALVRAQVLRETGVFDTRLTSLEDWDLWLRVAGDWPMRGIAEPLARYRVYGGSMATDAARMHTNRLAVLSKHFGPPLGEPAGWPDEKQRAYGFAFRSAALGHIQQGEADEGWSYLARAAAIYPPLLDRLDTFYELACGGQPRGYRGQADLLDLEANGAQMLRNLDALFEGAGPEVLAMRRPAYGNAYLALAMLGDQAGRWPEARRFLWRALRADPRLLRSASVVRRLIKLSMGRRAAGRVGHILGGRG